MLEETYTMKYIKKIIIYNLFFYIFLFVFVINIEARFVCKNLSKGSYYPEGSTNLVCSIVGNVFLSDVNKTSCKEDSTGAVCYFATRVAKGCSSGICANSIQRLITYSGGGFSIDQCEDDPSCNPTPTPTPIPCPADNYGGCALSGCPEGQRKNIPILIIQVLGVVN